VLLVIWFKPTPNSDTRVARGDKKGAHSSTSVMALLVGSAMLPGKISISEIVALGAVLSWV
jgi:hypothetical protein